MDDDALIERLLGVRVWRRGDQRAPHKPLLMLLALARVQRGEPRWMPYDEVHARLGELLRDFGPPRRSVHPEYPFWRLQNDGDFWVIPQQDALIEARGDASRTGDVPRGVLLDHDAQGGFEASVDATLRARPDLVNRLVDRILDAHFPPSMHDDLLDTIGLPWVATPTAASRRRDPAFRATILRIYQHRCAVCGYDGRLDHAHLGLEAAHVKWHAHGGPDVEDNGLALCVFHHRAFDRGALGLSPDRRVLVSQHAHGSAMVDDLLHRFAGRPLAEPVPGAAPVAEAHVEWHRREVFRPPARAA